jgi:hypothetical protein
MIPVDRSDYSICLSLQPPFRKKSSHDMPQLMYGPTVDSVVDKFTITVWRASEFPENHMKIAVPWWTND